MKTDALATAAALTDHDLLARLDVLSGAEREATAEVVAHLAALDARPALFAARGYGSLFSYCTRALHLSEDAACNRIDAARACRRYPIVLGLLSDGALSLTSIRLLAKHLTAQNHVAVLDRARGRTRREIEGLVAELAPLPDAATSVRRLSDAPAVRRPVLNSWTAPADATLEAGTPSTSRALAALEATGASAAASPAASSTVWRPAPHSRVQASAPSRYRVQVTIGEAGHEALRRLQELLRREVPDGDPGTIVERALLSLMKRVEGTKAATPRPRCEATRPGTDTPAATREPRATSRYVPRGIRRAVWQRDGGRCAFVATDGVRCPERTFLELHHRHPCALGGPATTETIALRCRRHNQYEAELDFGRTRRTLPIAPTVVVP
jgi:hypothetical protein